MTDRFPRISQLQQALAQKLPMREEDQKRLDSKFRLEFNFNSNHMEGNTLTYGETKLLLLFDQTEGNHSGREIEEMKAHDVALKLIQVWAQESKERPLTEQAIKELNRIILVRPFWKEAITPSGGTTRREIHVGDYKAYPNSVRLPNGELFEYASPKDTIALMGELVGWYRKSLEEGALHPIELAALLHYKFVRIHPFDDGNGRVARLLMNYVLYWFELPPVVIKSSDKKRYLQALNRADAGNEQAFVDYIAQQLEWSLALSLKAAKGESVEEEDDLDKQISLLERDAKALHESLNPRSKEMIDRLWLSELSHFFMDLEGLLGKSLDLFGEIQIRVIPFFEGSGMPHDCLSLSEVAKTVHSEIKSQPKELSRVQIELRLAELKSLKEPMVISFEFYLDFAKYYFRIGIMNKPVQQEFDYEKPGLLLELQDFAVLVKREIQTQVLKLAGKL
jgi:Fic family protein